MPKRTPESGWLPKVRPHTGPDGRTRARVRLAGKDHYLGLFGSAEAQEKYRQLVAAWLATNGQPAPPVITDPARLTIFNLVSRWIRHAEREYARPSGRPSSELCCYRILCRYLADGYGAHRIAEFGPKHLKELREQFVAHRWTRAPKSKDTTVGKPWCRRQINDHVRRVIRIFRWGVSEELVPADVLHRLETLPPLQRGRSEAPDRPKAKSVTWATVEKTLPHLTFHAAALVQILWLTGARSGELCGLRPCDLNRSAEVAPEWCYEPERHKTARHGKAKTIWFGQRAQKVLAPLLASCADDEPLFKTTDEPRSYRWEPHYTPDSIFRLVRRACRKAGVAAWTPKQLRAGRATEVEAECGLEEAAAVLGDRLDTTRHHYSHARDIARRVARQMG